MVVIYGNIFFFIDILQIRCEGKYFKCWTVLQQVKYLWKLNIPFKYSNAQLTRGKGHSVDDVPKCVSPNCLCSSSYEENNEAVSVE